MLSCVWCGEGRVYVLNQRQLRLAGRPAAVLGNDFFVNNCGICVPG